MSKPWQPYAQHILDAIAKIRRIQKRGDIASEKNSTPVPFDCTGTLRLISM